MGAPAAAGASLLADPSAEEPLRPCLWRTPDYRGGRECTGRAHHLDTAGRGDRHSSTGGRVVPAAREGPTQPGKAATETGQPVGAVRLRRSRIVSFSNPVLSWLAEGDPSGAEVEGQT